MEIKDDDKYWIDENNNKWTKSIYNKEQSIELSKTLINCKNCVDCDSCNSCYFCDSCESCYYCDYCYSSISCTYCKSCNSCKSCDSCNSCYSCNSCNSCDFCYYCELCDSLKNFKKNPNRYAQKGLGSKWENTCIYWTCEDDVRVVCGCFNGTINEFKKAAIRKYNEDHGYIKFVKTVEMLIKMESELQ